MDPLNNRDLSFYELHFRASMQLFKIILVSNTLAQQVIQIYHNSLAPKWSVVNINLYFYAKPMSLRETLQ